MQPIKSSKIRMFNRITLDYPFIGRILANSKKNETRKFHSYCVGLPRSGTHSIANMFKSKFKAAHEPFATGLIRLVLDERLNKKSFTEQFLLTRDNLLCLEMEANHLMHRFTPHLVEIFPTSKFILTVREPRSWLESEYNKILKSIRGTEKGYNWRTYHRFKYGQKNLKGLNSVNDKQGEELIKSMLRYYRNHINFVLDSVPKERLLVLDTFKINRKIDYITKFLECSEIKNNLTKKHSAKNKMKISINKIVPENVLSSIIKKECEVFIENKVPVLAEYIK